MGLLAAETSSTTRINALSWLFPSHPAHTNLFLGGRASTPPESLPRATKAPRNERPLTSWPQLRCRFSSFRVKSHWVTRKPADKAKQPVRVHMRSSSALSYTIRCSRAIRARSELPQMDIDRKMQHGVSKRAPHTQSRLKGKSEVGQLPNLQTS